MKPQFRSLLTIAAAALMCVSVRADVIHFATTLTGPQESPPNASPGTGSATATYDSAAHTLLLDISFSGLLGNTTASHIHAATASPGAGTAGVATTTPTFAGFPLGVTSGTYQTTLDLSLTTSYNAAYLNNLVNLGDVMKAEDSLISSMLAGTAYLNVHSSSFPGGEIRGFWARVPDTGATALLLAPAILLLNLVRRRVHM